jgi:uncharacterized protein YndB with AHSA1/START domain
MVERKVTHSTFTVERRYPAAIERVFRALSDKDAKSKWFVGPSEWRRERYEMDFRVGGRERLVGAVPGQAPHSFDAVYFDIVENRRIIYAYDMHAAEERISVSLATIELAPDGAGTKLTFTEQGAFLEGYDDPATRELGTRGLLDQLGQSLEG